MRGLWYGGLLGSLETCHRSVRQRLGTTLRLFFRALSFRRYDTGTR